MNIILILILISHIIKVKSDNSVCTQNVDNKYYKIKYCTSFSYQEVHLICQNKKYTFFGLSNSYTLSNTLLKDYTYYILNDKNEMSKLNNIEELCMFLIYSKNDICIQQKQSYDIYCFTVNDADIEKGLNHLYDYRFSHKSQLSNPVNTYINQIYKYQITNPQQLQSPSSVIEIFKLIMESSSWITIYKQLTDDIFFEYFIKSYSSITSNKLTIPNPIRYQYNNLTPASKWIQTMNDIYLFIKNLDDPEIAMKLIMYGYKQFDDFQIINKYCSNLELNDPKCNFSNIDCLNNQLDNYIIDLMLLEKCNPKSTVLPDNNQKILNIFCGLNFDDSRCEDHILKHQTDLKRYFKTIHDIFNTIDIIHIYPDKLISSFLNFLKSTKFSNLYKCNKNDKTLEKNSIILALKKILKASMYQKINYDISTLIQILIDNKILTDNEINTICISVNKEKQTFAMILTENTIQDVNKLISFCNL